MSWGFFASPTIFFYFKSNQIAHSRASSFCATHKTTMVLIRIKTHPRLFSQSGLKLTLKASDQFICQKLFYRKITLKDNSLQVIAKYVVIHTSKSFHTRITTFHHLAIIPFPYFQVNHVRVISSLVTYGFKLWA